VPRTLPTLTLAACVLSASAAQPVPSTAPGTAAVQRLQAIEDRLEIQDLVTGKYAKALDTADPDAYAALFTEDAFLSVAGKPYRGRKEIRQMMLEIRKYFADFDTRPATYHGTRWVPMRHIVTNALVSIAGDRATSESYSTEIGSNGRDDAGHGNPQSLTNVCRYEDNLIKLSGHWLISRRLIVCDMFGKRSHAPDMYPNTVSPSDESP